MMERYIAVRIICVAFNSRAVAAAAPVVTRIVLVFGSFFKLVLSSFDGPL